MTRFNEPLDMGINLFFHNF